MNSRAAYSMRFSGDLETSSDSGLPAAAGPVPNVNSGTSLARQKQIPLIMPMMNIKKKSRRCSGDDGLRLYKSSITVSSKHMKNDIFPDNLSKFG